MVMEYLEGLTLRKYCEKKGAIPATEFLLIFRSVLSAQVNGSDRQIILGISNRKTYF